MSDFNAALYKLVGERLKELRSSAGYSQEELAQKIGILSRTSISNIETGRHQPPLHTLSHLSKALNTEIHYILPTYEEVKAFIRATNPEEENIFVILHKQALTEPTKKTLESILKKY